jgi:hypothetical protein
MACYGDSFTCFCYFNAQLGPLGLFYMGVHFEMDVWGLSKACINSFIFG